MDLLLTTRLFYFITFIFLLQSAPIICTGTEPNPPRWPDTVVVCDPSTPSITQAAADAAFSYNGGHSPPFHGQWSNYSYAFLLKPGVHAVDIRVGYYTSVVGLGRSPADVEIRNVICENGDFDFAGGALGNFWRSAENFKTKPTLVFNSEVSMVWAVSQAAPLRRVIVDGVLNLYQYNGGGAAGYASGGFIADCTASRINSGSQQQFFLRNTAAEFSGGVWNMVFVGNTGSFPPDHCGIDGHQVPSSVVAATPIIAEKPYISIDDRGLYSLNVPWLERDKTGPTTDFAAADSVDFSSVYVASPSDSAATINAKLSQGLHLVLTPGTYTLDAPINVTHPNTIVLGIGLPILQPAAATPCIVVAAVDGVRVAGLILQAGRLRSSALLLFGSADHKGADSNPSFIHDVYARVGGLNDPDDYQVSVDNIMVIASGHVVVDNIWLWRADHDVKGAVYNSSNYAGTGLVVEGGNVTAYGVAVEHTLQDLLQWNGDDGRLFFYQSEFPYDVTQENYADRGFVSYRVADGVLAHEAVGVGMYSFFRDHAVNMKTAAQTGASPGVKIKHACTKFLNGQGSIAHVVNTLGQSTSSASDPPVYVC